MNPVKQRVFQLLNRLLDSKSNKLINRFIPILVPFNYGHKISIKKRSKQEVISTLPRIRKNLNHIQTIHACAIATLGEFSAGILLLHHFPLSDYRIIMKTLHSEYHWQARLDLESKALLPSLEQYQSELVENGVVLIPMEVEIHDLENRLVATVTTHWQIKCWDQVKLR